MKTKQETYVVSQMKKDYEKRVGEHNRLVFDCPIQRPEGQWGNIEQSLLIHSILQGYLVPSVCIVQNGADAFEPMTVLDGKQRMTIIYNYITNKNFKLSKVTPPVVIEVPEIDENGRLIKDERGITKTHTEAVEIKNRTFEQLPKTFREKINNFELSVTLITEATKKELEEQIFRLNNGKSLSATSKAIMKAGIDVTETVRVRILGNNFFSNRFSTMTKSQIKNEDNMKCALHALAVLTNADFNKLTGKELTKFTEGLKEKWQERTITEREIEYCNDLFENLHYWLPSEETFEGKEILTSVHIPIMIMNVEKAQELMANGELTIEQYKEFLKYWTTEGFYKEEYRECSEGSPSDKKNIERRIDFMEKELCDFIGTKPIVAQEEDVSEKVEFKTFENFVEEFISTEIPHNTRETALKILMQFTNYPTRDFSDDGIADFENWLTRENIPQKTFGDCILNTVNLKNCLNDVEATDKFSANDIAILIHRVYADGEDLDRDAFELWLDEFENTNHCEESGSNNALLEKECFMKNSYETFIRENSKGE